ncbi:hypothetical protein DESC_720249 [Desulfosarcina cetonica]|nr:hypothetical protein DESC_720249 [Desulfosarcina cetonica]
MNGGNRLGEFHQPAGHAAHGDVTGNRIQQFGIQKDVTVGIGPTMGNANDAGQDVRGNQSAHLDAAARGFDADHFTVEDMVLVGSGRVDFRFRLGANDAQGGIAHLGIDVFDGPGAGVEDFRVFLDQFRITDLALFGLDMHGNGVGTQLGHAIRVKLDLFAGGKEAFFLVESVGFFAEVEAFGIVFQLLHGDAGGGEEMFGHFLVRVPREVFSISHLATQFTPDPPDRLAFVQRLDDGFAQHDERLAIGDAVGEATDTGLFKTGAGGQNVVGQVGGFGHHGIHDHDQVLVLHGGVEAFGIGKGHGRVAARTDESLDRVGVARDHGVAHQG